MDPRTSRCISYWKLGYSSYLSLPDGILLFRTSEIRLFFEKKLPTSTAEIFQFGVHCFNLNLPRCFCSPENLGNQKNEHQKCLGWKPNPTLFRHNLTLRKVVKVQDLLIRQLQDLPNWWLGFGALGSERSRAIPNFFNSEMKAAQGFHTFSFYRKHEETASKSHHYKQRACKKSVRLDLWFDVLPWSKLFKKNTS